MKRWFTLFAVMIVALGSVMLTGCTPEEGGDEAEGDAAPDETASVSTDSGAAAAGEVAAPAATEGS